MSDPKLTPEEHEALADAIVSVGCLAVGLVIALLVGAVRWVWLQ